MRLADRDHQHRLLGELLVQLVERARAEAREAVERIGEQVEALRQVALLGHVADVVLELLRERLARAREQRLTLREGRELTLNRRVRVCVCVSLRGGAALCGIRTRGRGGRIAGAVLVGVDQRYGTRVEISHDDVGPRVD